MDIFEISDFTLSSDLERFQADLEEALPRQDKHDDRTVGADEMARANWTQTRETLAFGKTKMALTIHRMASRDSPDLLRQLMASESDFPPRGHCLSRYFGVSHFSIVSLDETLAEDKVRLLLSAAALSKTGLPLFCAVSAARRLYFGVAVLESARGRTSSVFTYPLMC